MRRFLSYSLLTAASVALDQWIKALVEAGLPFQQPVELIPFLALYRTYNTGVAFSMLSWMGGMGLIVLSLAVVGFVAWLASRTTAGQVASRIGFALIVGGAIGNLIDRLQHGHVIDFIQWYWRDHYWPAFNVADAAIVGGAVGIALFGLLQKKPAGAA